MHIDCHVVSCEDYVEGFIGHITPTPVSHFAAEFREVDSRPISGRATFSERGPDETFRSSSWAGVTNENPKMGMYITIRLLQSKQISEMAGAACREEVFQCPARWMSSTT